MRHNSQRHGQFFLFYFPKSLNGLSLLIRAVVFQNCISYLCYPSSQLASICCRLGLANSSAMSRRLEKLAANKSPNPSCFPCLQWWTTLHLIYEMIWVVCVCARVRPCVRVKWRKCALTKQHVVLCLFYIRLSISVCWNAFYLSVKKQCSACVCVFVKCF